MPSYDWISRTGPISKDLRAPRKPQPPEIATIPTGAADAPLPETVHPSGGCRARGCLSRGRAGAVEGLGRSGRGEAKARAAPPTAPQPEPVPGRGLRRAPPGPRSCSGARAVRSRVRRRYRARPRGDPSARCARSG